MCKNSGGLILELRGHGEGIKNSGGLSLELGRGGRQAGIGGLRCDGWEGLSVAVRETGCRVKVEAEVSGEGTAYCSGGRMEPWAGGKEVTSNGQTPDLSGTGDAG